MQNGTTKIKSGFENITEKSIRQTNNIKQYIQTDLKQHVQKELKRGWEEGKSKKKDHRKVQITLCLILIQEVQPSQLGCEIPRAKTRDIFPKLFNLKRFRGEANKLVLKSRGPKQTLYIESFFHVSLQSSHF